ncbi:MAG: hypothetical protein GX077_10065 [Tissierellia bacterium]|nr:hypothetical protein [Tissierellia bacterium]
MKKIGLNFVRLFSGYFLYALGIVMAINANLGIAPWDVLNQGIGNILNITIGKASILVGFVIVLIDIYLGENVGWGTVFNMIFVGIFIDLIIASNLVPKFDSFIPSLLLILAGLLIIGFACYLYVGAGYGIGPRDGLMVAITKKTKKSVKFVKNTIEVTVLIIGYLLGGSVGIGTAIMSICGGYFFEFVFKLVNFNVAEVKHRYIIDDIRFIKEKLREKKEGEV